MLVAWVVIGLALNLLSLLGVPVKYAEAGLALAGLTHCIVGFWRDGGPRISAPGAYFFSAAVFVFLPGLYVVLNGVTFPHGSLAVLTALNYWYFAQLAMYHLVWERRAAAHAPPRRVVAPEVLRWGRWWGLALTVVGTAASVARLGDPGLSSGMAFTGVVLLATATFARSTRLSMLDYALVAVAVLAYVEFVFTGFGRLQLGALGLAVVMALAPRWRGRRAKAALVLGSVPALIYLARNRVAFATETIGASVAAGYSGLESVYGPFVRFAELLPIESSGGVEYSNLHTFWASLVAMIPREVWPSKPIGFGAELGLLFRPELAGSGHSELALLSGEFLFAGGWLGLAVLPAALALAVLLLDRAAANPGPAGFGTRKALLGAVAMFILAASIADLVWGGTFSYSSRVGPRLLVLLVLFVLFAWRRGRDGDEKGNRRGLARDADRVPVQRG